VVRRLLHSSQSRCCQLQLLLAKTESPWTAAEIKAIRTEISKELDRLRKELAVVELEMDALIQESGEGAGDDQADAGTKTFEREHEMSLVINARDMVLQTERALERIDNKSYGNCEECGSPIGKARLTSFPSRNSLHAVQAEGRTALKVRRWRTLFSVAWAVWVLDLATKIWAVNNSFLQIQHQSNWLIFSN